MKKLIFFCCLVAASSIFARCAGAQVLIIANPSVRDADVSKSDLKEVFTGGSANFRNGSHVVPVLLKPGAASDEFLSAYIGKNDTAFRAGWRSLVFSGQASMPKSLESEAAVVDFVARNAGAIGYIGKATPHEGVKVLAVR